MAYDVTSWFKQQIEDKAPANIQRAFAIGTDTNLESQVTRWPKVERKSSQLKPARYKISLSNHDGDFNNYYENLYNLPSSATASFGFTHPTSGDELLQTFGGWIKEYSYRDRDFNIVVRDRLWDFTEKKVGDSDNTVTFSQEIPSDIAWTLCTCYGELSTTAGSNNPDINYDSFELWANEFSSDNVLASARYDGIKVAEALDDIKEMTDSAIWIENDGKLNFKRFVAPSSLEYTLDESKYSDFEIKVEGLRMINKCWVYWDWAQESDYWQSTVFAIDSTSVNTFGLHEEIFKSETFWFVDSVSALNLAQRKINLLKQPPRKFKVKTGLLGNFLQIADTMRLSNSFFNITSGSGWRITDYGFDMNTFETEYTMDEATVMNAFYLDVSTLDDNDLLL
ncbi:MAG: hypothetical protein ACYS8Y_08580 [Planctomycetota bacterium]|jgi:hypothetical protein